MWTSKQVADGITTTRAGIGFVLMWLGSTYGDAALGLVAGLMLLDWIGDIIDGPLARRSRVPAHTWIGDHDLEVDMFVSVGLLVYLWQSGYWSTLALLIYLLCWLVIFWISGMERSLGMLFQAPAYGFLIYQALQQTPFMGWTIVCFLAALIVFTWPRFPNEMLSDFLQDIAQIVNRGSGRR